VECGGKRSANRFELTTPELEPHVNPKRRRRSALPAHSKRTL
jgi:hypothetical protein